MTLTSTTPLRDSTGLLTPSVQDDTGPFGSFLSHVKSSSVHRRTTSSQGWTGVTPITHYLVPFPLSDTATEPVFGDHLVWT